MKRPWCGRTGAFLFVLTLAGCANERCFTAMTVTTVYGGAWEVDRTTLVGLCWEDCHPIHDQVRICIEASGKPERALPEY